MQTLPWPLLLSTPKVAKHQIKSRSCVCLTHFIRSHESDLSVKFGNKKIFFFVKNLWQKMAEKFFFWQTARNSSDWKNGFKSFIVASLKQQFFSKKKSRASWTFLVKSFFVLKLFVPRFFSFVQRPFILLFVRLFSFPLIWKRNTTERGDGGALVLFSWWQQQQRQSINWKTF